MTKLFTAHRFRDALRRIAAAIGLLSLGTPALADTQTLPLQVAPTPQVVADPVRPALWKVSDEDTTIYLFGTIHVLKPGIEWFDGPVANAFESSEQLVTEVGGLDSLGTAQALLASAMLPQGETLRAKLTSEQRIAFESALANVGIPPAAVDRFKPWYAAVVLSSLPLIQAGYAVDQGVEAQLGRRALQADKPTGALETPAFQIALFDSLPEATQIAYLNQVVEQVPDMAAQIDDLVSEWSLGDATALAALVNSDKSDPLLTEKLLNQRNRSWADWIGQRMDQPGTIFMAVGAGHLAGPDSVQAVLAQRGIASERVQ